MLFFSLSCGCVADEPKALNDLRNSFERARNEAVAPLEKKYVEALKALKITLTRQADLQGALAVEAELAKYQPQKIDDGTQFIGEWIDVNEKPPYNGTSIMADHTVKRLGSSDVGTWSIKGGSMVLKWRSGNETRIKLNQNAAPIEVTGLNGKKATWKHLQ
jgi:hypothetical protein